MLDKKVSSWNDDDFISGVDSAFQSYQNLLKLSQSPLAHSPLTIPALILGVDNLASDDYGRAMRVVLRWAVYRLAPSTAVPSIGKILPFYDPLWQDTHWQYHHILRYSYLEPLSADVMDDLNCTGIVDALLSLTGVKNSGVFYRKRKQAIRDVAQMLQRQLKHRHDDAIIRRMAVEALDKTLNTHKQARYLLNIAATFRSVFPRTLLFELANRERVRHAEEALQYLITHRLLQIESEGEALAMPPALQVYIHAQQTDYDVLRYRHQLAARYCQTQDQPLLTAWHLRLSKRLPEAVDLLLAEADNLKSRLQTADLLSALLQFNEGQLSPVQLIQTQMLLSDLFLQMGDRDKALIACRRALAASPEAAQKALIYHRLGKLHEDHNQMHALGHYQEADKYFLAADLGRAALLKDRAWLHIHRREWGAAEVDLSLALEIVRDAYQQADINDGLASLYRQQKLYDQAIAHARQALILREEAGDLSQIAHSYNNLGLIYVQMKEMKAAIASYEEALTLYQQAGNREKTATAKLNIGAAFFREHHYAEAIGWYQECLQIFQDINSPRGQVQAHYNLAEAFVELGKAAEADKQWKMGYRLSKDEGLGDQLDWFAELRKTLPAVEDGLDNLTVNEETAVKIVRDNGRVTTKLLMAQAHIARTNASRILCQLQERNILEKRGKGRGTHYIFH